MSKKFCPSDRKFDDFVGVAKAGHSHPTPDVGGRIQQISLEILHDLGMSDMAIGAYLRRFRLGDRAPQPIQYATEARRPTELAGDAPFEGEDWRWGVRASRLDF